MVTLRRYHESDIPLLVEYLNNPRVTHYLTSRIPNIFRSTDIVRLFANVVEDNTASRRVLEKCGYRLECLLEKAFFKHNGFSNACLYATLAPG